MEEHRRRAVSPLLHFEFILWVLILGMTCYATYIGASPTIENTCWSNNPCEYSEDIIPSICTVDKADDVVLTPACNVIWNYGDEFSYCYDQWLDYGATALYNNFNGTRPDVSYVALQGESTNIDATNVTAITVPDYASFTPINYATYVCDKSVGVHSRKFENFFIEAFGLTATVFLTDIYTVGQEMEQLPLVIKQLFMELLGVNLTLEGHSPWYKCFSPRCQYLLTEGDNCEEWNTLFNVPPSSNRKSAYLSTIYASWALLCVQALIVYVAFNAWPQYENEEAWTGTVRSWGKTFRCGDKLEAKTDTGHQANKEIGTFLHILFGAIDLDPSDQFLGMFLVSERQKLRRHRFALAALRRAGVDIRPASRSWFVRCFQWLMRPSSLFRDWFHSRDDVKLVSTLEGPAALVLKTVGGREGGKAKKERKNKDRIGSSMSPSSPMANAGVNSSTETSSSSPTISLPPSPFDAYSPQTDTHDNVVINGAPTLPPSPFAAPPPQQATHPSIAAPTTGEAQGVSDDNAANVTSSSEPSSPPPELVDIQGIDSSNPPTHQRGPLPSNPPSIAHSFVRLISLRPSLGKVANTKRGQTKMNIQPTIDESPTSSKKISSWATWFSSSSEGTAMSHSLSSMPASAAKKKLIVDARAQPLVTPVTLHHLALPMNISSYEAAQIYGITDSAPVHKRELRDLLNLSYFAKAAYGLQKVKWAYGSQSQGCVASTWDSVLATPFCAPCSKPLGFDSHFRKRNFNAILQLTEIDASDLLYVSYASAAFGVLPYMVLLHRESQSVVVSVRGTVGFDDLITDLLSNPVDARASMPTWVKESLGEDAPMYAHAGILSSTNAVLKDLEEKGLLAAMLNQASEGNDKNGGGGDKGLFGNLPVQDPPSRSASGDINNISSNPQFDASQLAEAKAELDGGAAQKRQTQRMLMRLRTMHEDDELDLDLDRAQTVVKEAIGSRGWKVVVTGHSLGAAVACMMSFQLRQYFPTLRCLAFCPPGGLISGNLATLAKGFCTSVVVGCDCISRLSFPTTQRIVDDMVLALARCKRPKLAVLLDAILGRRSDPETSPPTFCSFEDMGAEASAALKRYVATSKLHSEGADTRDLFPPGRIIHLRPFAAAGKRGQDPKNDVWDAVWANGEQLIAEGVILSFDMMRHHRMPTLQEALQSALAGEAVATRKKETIQEDAPV